MAGAGGAFMMPVTALDALTSVLPERNHLLACLLIELANVFDRFSMDGFAALREAWQACHAWQGRTVRVLHDGKMEMEGVCLGADNDGVLMVRVGDDVRRCLAGDVSLRIAA